jgi:hypothetical protein
MNKSIVNISQEQYKNYPNIIFEYCIEIISLILLFIFIETIGNYFDIYLTEIFLLGLIIYSGIHSENYSGILGVIAFNYFIIYLVYISSTYIYNYSQK